MVRNSKIPDHDSGPYLGRKWRCGVRKRGRRRFHNEFRTMIPFAPKFRTMIHVWRGFYAKSQTNFGTFLPLAWLHDDFTNDNVARSLDYGRRHSVWTLQSSCELNVFGATCINEQTQKAPHLLPWHQEQDPACRVRGSALTHISCAICGRRRYTDTWWSEFLINCAR